MLALKTILALAISLAATATLTAGPTCVFGINAYNRNSSQKPFVFDEFPQLAETPVTKAAAKAFRNRWLDMVAEKGKILQSYPNTECLCFRYHTLADSVILMSLKVGLATGHTLQLPSCPFGSFSLVLLTGCCSTPAVSVDSGAGECLAIAIGSEVNDAQIDAEKITNFYWWLLFKVYGAVQEKLLVSVNKVALATNACKVCSLVFSKNIWNHQAARTDRKNANPVTVFERDDALVVGHCSTGTKLWALLFSGTRESIGRFRNGEDSHLGRETKEITALTISKTMDRRLAENSCIKTNSCCKCCRFVELLNGIEQGSRLCCIRQKSQLQCQLHCGIIGSTSLPSKICGSNFI